MAQEDFDKGKELGQKVRLALPPICLFTIILILIFDYIQNGSFNSISFGCMLITIGPALRSTKYKDNANAMMFSNFALFIGTIVLILSLLW